jgi:hypothetical protein
MTPVIAMEYAATAAQSTEFAVACHCINKGANSAKAGADITIMVK